MLHLNKIRSALRVHTPEKRRLGAWDTPIQERSSSAEFRMDSEPIGLRWCGGELHLHRTPHYYNKRCRILCRSRSFPNRSRCGCLCSVDRVAPNPQAVLQFGEVYHRVLPAFGMVSETMQCGFETSYGCLRGEAQRRRRDYQKNKVNCCR